MNAEVREASEAMWRALEQKNTNDDVRWYLAKYLDACIEIDKLKKKLRRKK